MTPRNKLLLCGFALVGVATLPAIAQDRPESILPPGFEQPSPAPKQAPRPSSTAPSRSDRPTEASPSRSSVSPTQPAQGDDLSFTDQGPVRALQIELPSSAIRDVLTVGSLYPSQTGLSAQPWGNFSGSYLSKLMRSTDAPLASRWGHILLRNVLLTRVEAPQNVQPADWVAERAWLLLRMGEADAARMLVDGVGVRNYSPKLFQVAVQTALANSDPSALCPLQAGIRRVEGTILPMVQAMCASLSGNGAVAASRIEGTRRSGDIAPIDWSLAEKVVGAGTDSRRAATIEWEGVDRINSWRFGLATATGLEFPKELIDGAPARLKAWHARSPILPPEARLATGAVATALGVFSAQAFIDLQSDYYDNADPDLIGGSAAQQLRRAMVASDTDGRVSAIQALLDGVETPIDRMAALALVSRPAAFVPPDSALDAIAPDLVAALLLAGNERAASRWSAVIPAMDKAARLRIWAMLALGSPNFAVRSGDLDDFISNDDSPGKRRSALLVAGLAGLGRIDTSEASDLSEEYGFRLGKKTRWTEAIDRASSARSGGASAILAGVGLQGSRPEAIPAFHMFRLVSALRRNGLEFHARMIAAEALART